MTEEEARIIRAKKAAKAAKQREANRRAKERAKRIIERNDSAGGLGRVHYERA